MSRQQRIPYSILFLILAALFFTRVLVQFILLFTSPGFLPPFELWHSEAVSYPALLALQVVILSLQLWAIWSVPHLGRHVGWGNVLIVLGWLYVGVMAIRLVIGSAKLHDHSWFDGAIPTAFHFVLAAFVLIYGSALKGRWRKNDVPSSNNILVRWLAYPALMCGAYALFSWMKGVGTPLVFSTYLSVLIGAFGILLHETFQPNREGWRPTRKDVLNDGVFLALVQVGLPFMLKVWVAIWLATSTLSQLMPLQNIWPTNWPILAQVALMAVTAEFFRYWFHRLMHELNPLWRLHAVHHASDKLYTVNVGRFHPLDKTIQFAGDTLPFILLGVGADVFAAYFVLYAMNGFYQHSNADLRLGPLNWIIAGPELHRWHHSTVIEEGHHNYGNNLIIWDAVFRTRYLPTGKTVNDIGIGNKAWPRGFFRQILAPFTMPTEYTKK